MQETLIGAWGKETEGETANNGCIIKPAGTVATGT